MADWADDLDRVAEAHGWRWLGQPQRNGRRYGHGDLTVRVYWDRARRQVVRASLTRLGYTMAMITDDTASARAQGWLAAQAAGPDL